VTQSLFNVIYDMDLKEICKLSELDVLFTILSGAAHDMDHPGTNSIFEIKCRSKMALLYNDTSVLENHHAASFFFMIDNQSQGCDIFTSLSNKEKDEARKVIIDNILGTDMTRHGAIMKEMQDIASQPVESRNMHDKNKAAVLRALVHAVDIGNPTRCYSVALDWARRIVKEFFYQGDRERSLGLDISMLCDRNTNNFASGQVGFINFMIVPYFKVLT